jgi:HAD superfamily phosphoserine phosphatase-like hydrolase
MNVAVFDVCGTLYQSNTSLDFVEFFLRQRKNVAGAAYMKLSRSKPGKLVHYAIARYLKRDVLRSTAAALLRGCTLEELEQASREFVQTVLVQRRKHNVLALLEQYKANGYHVLLLSASFSFVISAVAEEVQADAFIASELKTHNDVIQGTYAIDLLYQKKAVLLEQYPDIAELVVVTDNKADLELLKLASHGYAVYNNTRNYQFWNALNLNHIQLMGVS